MRYMAARKLQDAFATQSVLERFLADGAFASDEGPLSACTGPFKLQHTGHRTTRSPVEGSLDGIAICRCLPGVCDACVSEVALLFGLLGVVPSY